MVIIGFVTIITIPLILIYHNLVQESSIEISSHQINQIAKKVVDEAESVYYLGEPSQTTIKVNIPSNIVSASLTGNEIVFKIRTKNGDSDVVQSTSVNITGSLPTKEGTYDITIKSKANHVEVSYG